MPIRVRANVNLSRQVVERVRPRVAAAVEKAALDGEATAKSLAPVDTGFLRSAIAAEPTGDPLRWTITSYASYSVYQEFGTRRMAAQPYMSPMADLVRARLTRAVASVI